MITLIAAGIGLIILVAIVVGIMDATQAPTWRQIAAERRAKWEAKQPQLHGPDPHAGHYFYNDDDTYDDESWDDD